MSHGGWAWSGRFHLIRPERTQCPSGSHEAHLWSESPWFQVKHLLEDGTMPKQYPSDFSERAVRPVTETRSDHGTEWSAIR